uniref:(northern house mosquito) hypothetical protein n=2 Tax=Culex pipiens TaxID=7175 RepID=A0A8D8ALF5_CULPI
MNGLGFQAYCRCVDVLMSSKIRFKLIHITAQLDRAVHFTQHIHPRVKHLLLTYPHKFRRSRPPLSGNRAQPLSMIVGCIPWRRSCCRPSTPASPWRWHLLQQNPHDRRADLFTSWELPSQKQVPFVVCEVKQKPTVVPRNVPLELPSRSCPGCGVSKLLSSAVDRSCRSVGFTAQP